MKITTLIDDALREIGVLSGTDEAAPHDHSFALRKLNRIASLYNTQHLLTAFIQNIQFNEPTGGWTSPIHIGPGHQFPGVAPTFMISVFVRYHDVDYELSPMMADQWAAISYKATHGIPARYYDQKMDQNSMKIYFDKIPVPGAKLHILAKTPMNSGVEFKTTDDITFEYGIEKMLIYRLALKLCPTFEVTGETKSTIAALLQETESSIKSHNYEPTTLTSSKTLTKKSRHKNRARF